MLIHVWLKGMPTWPLAMNLPELHGGLEASADAGNAPMVERADDAFFCKLNKNEWKSFSTISIIGFTFLRMPA
ncbi:hypothetical protein [Comamonas testosteroni]|uniref:hypothetical protein n=1 Tax=Comamonas testosteroni TaxID=285 RepID=UPI003D13B857